MTGNAGSGRAGGCRIGSKGAGRIRSRSEAGISGHSEGAQDYVSPAADRQLGLKLQAAGSVLAGPVAQDEAHGVRRRDDTVPAGCGGGVPERMIAFEVLPVNRVNKFYCLMGTWRVSSQLLGTHDAMVALAILSPVFFPVWNNPPATRSPALRQRHRELHFYVVHPYRNG